MHTQQALVVASAGFDPYAQHSDTGALFGKLERKISRLAKQVYKTTVKPLVNKTLPLLTPILKNMGPVGMVASGALSAMKAGLNGKSLESIAWAAAQGAAPIGIDRALKAAEQLRHGKSLVSVAISNAGKSFVPGTGEALGFGVAVELMKKTGSKAAFGVARRALGSEGSRRAFDAAVGTVSLAVKGTPLAARALGNRVIRVNTARAPISTQSPGLKSAQRALIRNPSLMTLNNAVVAQKLGTTVGTVRDAVRNVARSNILPWRALSLNAARFVLKHAPNSARIALRRSTDTAGLDQTGTKYVVEKGDYPTRIAQKLTGRATRFRELLQANPQKKIATTGQFKGSFATLNPGEVLNLPISWQKPSGVQVPQSAPPTSASAPRATVASAGAESAAPADMTPSILQAKAILAAWGATDGKNQSGLSDYGASPVDLTTTFGERDTMMLFSFQNWSRNNGTPLEPTGSLDSASLAALQAWVEKRAGGALALDLPTVYAASPGQPVPPAVMPQMIITGSAPPPQRVASAAPVSASAKKGGGLGMIAAGAIAGALIGGPAGALIGGIGGAAMG